MRFLLLNQAFYPDVVSTAQHLSDLAAALAARGHGVTVISSRRAYDDARRRFPRSETWRGVRILRVGGTGFGKNSKLGRVLDFISFSLLCCCRAAVLPAQDVVVALTSPPLIALLGLGLARLRHSRFVYWVMDLNPDEAIAAGWLRANSRPARALEWASRLALQKADQVIALDRFMFARLCKKGVPPSRISVLPPWPHDDAVWFDKAGRLRFRARHELEGKFVVMYSGNHSPCHPLDTVLAAAEQLAQDERIVFCFVGGGTEFGKIRNRVAKGASRGPVSRQGRGNVVCLPYQPLRELSESLSAADLHLTVLGEDLVGLVHPCKIYNILRIGTPVVYIGPAPSSVSEILAQAGDRVPFACLSHGDVPSLLKAIQRIRKTYGYFEAPRAPSRAYSQKALLGTLLRILERPNVAYNLHPCRNVSLDLDVTPGLPESCSGMAYILVIDDDPDTREVLHSTLESAGHEITLASDGKQGVEQYRARRADLVITDLYMPGQEGLETIKQLKMEFPESRIIAMSGKPTGGTMLTVAQRLGAIAVLQKPFLPEELLKVVEQAL